MKSPAKSSGTIATTSTRKSASPLPVPSAARLAALETEVQELRHQLAAERLDFEVKQAAAIGTRRKLESAPERYLNLYNAAPVGYLLLDRNGFIREANRTVLRLFGMPRRKLIDTLLLQYVGKAGRRKLQQHLSRCRHSPGRHPVVTELRLTSAAGRMFDGELTSVPAPAAVQPPAQALFHTVLVDISARKQGAAVVAQAEQQYRLLFELNTCPMYVFDEQTLEFLAVNAAAVKQYGWTKDEFLRMTAKEIRPAKDLARFRAALKAQRGSVMAFGGGWQHQRKDGSLFDVEVDVSAIEFAGRPARLVLVRDITAHKQAEEELRCSEAKFRRLYESMRDAFVSVDMSGRITDSNSAYQKMLGYSAEELRRLTYVSLTPGKWRRMEARLVRERILPHGYSGVFEKEYRRKDGTVFPVELSAFLIRDDAGKPAAMWAIVRDITERRRVEEELKQLNATLEQRVVVRTKELRDAHNRLRAITDNLLVGILTMDEHGLIQTFNPAAAVLFGYSPGEMEKRHVNTLMVFPHQSKGEWLLTCLQSNNHPFTAVDHEVLGRHKDGHALVISVNINDFICGGQRQYVVLARDITARKRLERELLESGERERLRLGHDLHDGLGQHLHALFYMASLLEKKAFRVAPEWAKEAGRLARQLEHALELMRSLARGLQPVNAVPDGLMFALRELADRTRSFYDVDCRFICPVPVLIQRHVSANHLYRIAQEAVNNAMKHGRPKRIRIKLAASQQRIVLGISDNGVGIRRQAGCRRGIGLHVMQYRADAIRGLLLVQRRSRGGTEVVCAVTRQALLLPPEEEDVKSPSTRHPA